MGCPPLGLDDMSGILWHVALGAFVFGSIALFFIVWKGLVINWRGGQP